MHSLPSSPHFTPPVGDPSRRTSGDVCVVPRSPEIDEAEARLNSCALVATIGGTRPSLTVTQVGRFLEEFFVLLPGDFKIYRYQPEDFLVEFASADAATRVLHSTPPSEAPFQLIWKRWRRQATGTLTHFRYKVLVQLKDIPGHARNVNTAQTVLGKACCDLVEATEEVNGCDRRSLYVAGWCLHPDFIPTEKFIFIPKPAENITGGNLFLRPQEIIQSSRPGLWYRVKVRLIEYQDWHDESSASSSEDEDYPGFRHRHRHHPWPRRFRP
ncbi:unnamed protein product [Urochloa decumbens]|uniref:RRM domain-containing protein n=1 Tax=Urochloa decumbens TaxID=240449 RepID=A0ABC9F5U4_9POAL